ERLGRRERGSVSSGALPVGSTTVERAAPPADAALANSETYPHTDSAIHRYSNIPEVLRLLPAEPAGDLKTTECETGSDTVVECAARVEIPAVAGIRVVVLAIPVGVREVRDDRLVLAELTRNEPALAIDACSTRHIGAEVQAAVDGVLGTARDERRASRQMQRPPLHQRRLRADADAEVAHI